MLNNMSRYARTPAILIPTLAVVLVVSLVLSVTAQPAAAQGVNVQFTELDCDSDPEVIVISNQGTQPVEMTGWNLQSDPPAQESLPLMSLGFLSPGESILVESGPASAAAFTWSRDFVFRNNDPTDFAQLASDAGDVLIKVNCGSVGQATATATIVGEITGETEYRVRAAFQKVDDAWKLAPAANTSGCSAFDRVA